MNVSLRALSWLVVVILQVRQGSSYFEGLSGDSDVFKNPNCGSAGSCDCAAFYSKCVNTGCRQCKCLKKKRIYRSDVRKCLSDMEARDPWCRYQFLKTRADVIPTIDLSRPCAKNQCSQPITAPYDKTKSTCRLSWVNYLENGTWHESRVREFQEIFQLRSSDYFSKKGYMYSLEWKTSNDTRMPKRLFQVSLECVDQDNMKESYCLMFRAKGKNEPALASIPELERKTKSNPSRPTTKATQPATARRHRPTRSIRRRTNTRPPKIVVVSDNFAVILAAVAGAVGTALVIIPLALFFKRTARQTSGRNMSQHCDHHSHSLNETDVEPRTSEETLSSYTSLKRNREIDEPPSIYQPLIKKKVNEVQNDDDKPVEEPIYITVEDDGPPLAKPPPIYHVLEELPSEEANGKSRNNSIQSL